MTDDGTNLDDNVENLYVNVKPIPRKRSSSDLLKDQLVDEQQLKSSEKKNFERLRSPSPPPNQINRHESDRSSVYSNSSYRKSVSFDLGDSDYKPVYRVDETQVSKPKYTIEDRISQQRSDYYSQFVDTPSEQSTPRNRIESDGNYFDYKSSLDRQQKRGILRSPSPMIESRDSIITAVKSRREKIADDDDSEIERENPFRDEILSKEPPLRAAPPPPPPIVQPTGIPVRRRNDYRSDSDNQDSDVSSQVEMRYRKLRPQSSYEASHQQKFDAVRQSIENLSHSNDNLSGGADSMKRIPIKIPVYHKSTGSINTRIPMGRPPVAPKPVVKHAELVRNEALDILRNEMEQGDYVEYKHDKESNQISILKPSRVRSEFFEDLPLPPPPQQHQTPATPTTPLTPTSNIIKRLASIERPKDSPPPPPPSASRIPMMNTKIELVPAKYDMLPAPSRPEYIRETTPPSDMVLVSEDMHRKILLEENELRNAIQTQRDIEEERSRNQFIYQQRQPQAYPSQQQYQSVYTNLAQQPPAPQLYPTTQVLPVQYSQLPVPQQTGYYHMIQQQQQQHQPPLQFNYPPQAAFSYGPPMGSYLVSDSKYTQPVMAQPGLVTNTLSQSQPSLLFNPNMSAFTPVPHTSQAMLSGGGSVGNGAVTYVSQSQIYPGQNQTQFYHQQPPIASTTIQHQPSLPNLTQFSSANNQNNQNHVQSSSSIPQQSDLSPIRIKSPSFQNFIPSEPSPTLTSFGKQTSV